ncbi:MAG: hybrid sensor histidine kinase/response regulator, partial [Bacteroidota bacterium]
MMKFKGFAVLVIFCLSWRPACAQPDLYNFSRIDINQGLSHNQVNDFLKDSKGFMWFGTLSGLNRYDGYTIKVFRNVPGDTTSIINNEINRMFEAPDGKIWINTWSGANIYDPKTETFNRNANSILQSLNIPVGTINYIKKDHSGNFWFVHAAEGLYIYRASDGRTVPLRHEPGNAATIGSQQLSAIEEDHQGNFWIIHKNGMFEKLDGKTLKVVYRNDQLSRQFKDEVQDYFVMPDHDGDLWIYVGNSNRGCFYFNSVDRSLRHIHSRSVAPTLNTDIVRKIVQDNKGLIWVATDHGGINIIDKKNNFAVHYVMHDDENDKSIGQNSINSLYKDDAGIIWAGTYKRGLSYYHENSSRFQLYKHQLSKPQSLPFDDINSFVEDDKGNLWIGTNGGGLIYFDRTNNTFKQWLHDPDNSNSLSGNVIVSLEIDHEKMLWVGTYYGGLNSFDGKKFTRYKSNPNDPNTTSDDNIWEIFEDSKNNLWIGTMKGGVDVLDASRKKFIHYRNGDPNSIHTTYVPAFIEDRDGNIWVGTGYGIDVLEKKSGRFVHYLNDIKDPTSLSNNSILSILQDRRGLIWVGTHGGLNLFDKENRSFKVFKEEDGLPHNSILTLLEDNRGNLWISTPNGLSNLIVTSGSNQEPLAFQFRNYDESDGLQGKQFNENAALKTAAGELIFGGGNGFNIFRPEDITINTSKPNVIFTDFQILNKSVRIGQSEQGDPMLLRSLTETEKITLGPADNVFSIEFAALSFFHSEKCQYKYMLEGFNKDWLSADANQRRVTYTNLDPGDYVFKVKASNHDGIWNEQPVQLRVTVLPPFWKTDIAFVIYVILIIGALLLARWLILANARMNFRIQQERQEAQRMHELDMMKIKFFTNVSHEFRTPLTLILTPLEKILKQTQDTDQKNQFQLIHRNARRLLNLVNQLLDFRRMEVQEVKFNPSEGDIVEFIRELTNSFSDLSEKKNIQLSFYTEVRELDIHFDQDKLEKILFNLLSNAFKFTPENGRVAVELTVKDLLERKWLEINVRDTGIGIPADKQEKIFERFFQHELPKSMVNQGSGIGLSITKEFVKAHGGSISVESEPGKGSCFTVMLPLQEIAHQSTRDEAIAYEIHTRETADHTDDVDNGAKKPVLLLVEDNEDFRFYLKDNLKLHYTILEAGNGKQGLEKATSAIPDLIVTDVM